MGVCSGGVRGGVCGGCVWGVVWNDSLAVPVNTYMITFPCDFWVAYTLKCRCESMKFGDL